MPIFFPTEAVTLWVKSLCVHMHLTSQLITCTLGNSSSDWDKVGSGVPQRTELGLSILLLYINDIADNLQSEIRLFPDDCILYTIVNNTAESVKLQHDIDQLDR